MANPLWSLFDLRLRTSRLELWLPTDDAIFDHAEFAAFNTKAQKLFTQWQTASVPLLKGLAKDDHPKPLIETIAEDLLATFKTAPLLDAYDVYQHLMDYWAEAMQDDCYLIADAGWKAGAQPREIRQVKNKEGKLVWPDKEDFKKGKRRFKVTTDSKHDLPIAPNLLDRQFTAEGPNQRWVGDTTEFDRRERQAVSGRNPRPVLALRRGLGGERHQ